MILELICATTLSLTMEQPQKLVKVEPFKLENVHLLPGPFLEATKKNAKYLLEVDIDRLLSGFRKNSGLAPKKEIYGGWENSGLAGHTLGHYLTACSQEYASSKDKRFKDRVDAIVAELVECQKSRPDGYISAIPDGDPKWAEIRAGKIRSRGFDLNGMWSPWYTHHKVFAGLLDADRLTGNKTAVTVAVKFGDWAIDLTKNLGSDQWEQMLTCEYGGMNEVLAELSIRTGEKRFADLARKFYDHRVLDPLKKNENSLVGKHSNTQIPKLIGLARLYEIEGKDEDRKASSFFWDTIVDHYTYAIGGNSNHEYLGLPDKLNEQLSTNTCETCNTYNMLKLTRHLFSWKPEAKYFDFYERAHLNHILGSQAPDYAGVTYFMPLVSGGFRNFSSPFHDFTCCHGSGLENHSKHAESIYFHQGKSDLYVNLFIPSRLEWGESQIELLTDFPKSGSVKMEFLKASRERQRIHIRHPWWAKASPVILKVNGTPVAQSSKPSSYIAIERSWVEGDKLEFELPMSLHLWPMPDNDKRVAIMFGPMVLSADLASSKDPEPRIPVLVTKGDTKDWIVRSFRDPYEFRTVEAGKPQELILRPFHLIGDRRYATYFDLFTDEQWKESEASYRKEEARIRDLEIRTVDFCRIGEMQPERDHQLESEKNDVRSSNGRGFRTPLDGGWFELVLMVSEVKSNELVVTYWGNDRVNPDFKIMVNGEVLASETLQELPKNVFSDRTYSLPKELVAGKNEITLRIQANSGKAGPSISGLRIVTKS